VNDTPTTLDLLLVPGFAMMSYASLIEPFRAANILAGRELYRWRHLSQGGAPVAASNGAAIVVDVGLADPSSFDTLFVLAAGRPDMLGDAATFAYLRRAARAGATLGGISAGPYLLARAGLLDGHRATIHWDHAPAFREAFPETPLEAGLYVIDRKRITCAGGVAALDLALDLIAREHGSALAHRVSEWFVAGSERTGGAVQRAPVAVASAPLARALAVIEADPAAARDRAGLASAAGVSVRQLERLFAAHLGRTPGEHDRMLRIARADTLLRQTTLSVIEIAVACGFINASHFARVFRRAMGQTPVSARRRM